MDYLESKLKNINLKISALYEKKSKYENIVKLITDKTLDEYLNEWYKKIEKYKILTRNDRSVLSKFGFNGYSIKNSNPCFNKIEKNIQRYQYTLFIYPHKLSYCNPCDIGRDFLNILKDDKFTFETYFNNDRECYPLCFATEKMENLIPDVGKDLIDQNINYEIRSFDPNWKKYICI